VTRPVVCTDSSALLADHDVGRLGIEVVPMTIVVDGEPLADLDPDAFFARLASGAAVSTSQPSPAMFAAAYAAAAARGAPSALSIHLDARVSGTAASAELAARDASIPVTVLPVETVSFGVGICARAAAAALLDGASGVEAAHRAGALGAALRNIFVASGAPGGRVSAPAGWAVATFEEGATRVLAPCASVGEALQAMVRHVLAGGRPICAAIGHASSASEPAADAFAAALADTDSVRELERYRVGPAVAAHTGPSSFGAFWWPAED
jgi:DegV family protein with EDD domain